MDQKLSSNTSILELERLTVLQSTALLDSPTEETFDRFTQLASTILETPVALVSLVDQDRQFFKSSVGLAHPWANTRQTPLSHSFCKHVVQTAEPLSIDDARQHPILKDNLAITELGVIAYLGIPLTTSQGHTLGSFCVIDSQPRQWSDRETTILQQLAKLVMEKIELRILAKQLQEDYLTQRQLELYRDEMVQMLVHDLRNPMSSFITGLELAQLENELPQHCRDYIDLAQRGGKELLEMINNILDFSQAEAGQLILNLTPVSASQLVASACAQMAPLAEKAGIALNQTINAQLKLAVDPQKVQRVLINLISNAIQHSPQGSCVVISVQAQTEVEEPESKHPTESVDPKATSLLRFSVTDAGQGIPRHAFDQIFEKFGQVKNPGVAKVSSGLGLPFSRMVVEAHGGRIWLDSELGRGTSFHFTLPKATA